MPERNDNVDDDARIIRWHRNESRVAISAEESAESNHFSRHSPLCPFIKYNHACDPAFDSLMMMKSFSGLPFIFPHLFSLSFSFTAASPHWILCEACFVLFRGDIMCEWPWRVGRRDIEWEQTEPRQHTKAPILYWVNVIVISNLMPSLLSVVRRSFLSLSIAILPALLFELNQQIRHKSDKSRGQLVMTWVSEPLD